MATDVTIGAVVNGKGELCAVECNDGHWQPLVKDLRA